MNNIIIDDVLSNLKFNEKGLIPAIAQDYMTKDILMMAWMNKDSIKATLEEQKAIYWSRSRKNLWRKGDTSGHIQILKGFYYDCDADTILLTVEQIGAACHTMRYSCFYNQVTEDGIKIIMQPMKE
jgi:phosphoribosyl-AMP cyclohydrolase